MAVSFTVGVKPHLAVKPFDYSEVSPFVLAALDRHRVLDAAALERLARHRRPKIKNHAGVVVGEIIAVRD